MDVFNRSAALDELGAGFDSAGFDSEGMHYGPWPHEGIASSFAGRFTLHLVVR
jgi:hypothetical protein